jgi:hypothetical protein
MARREDLHNNHQQHKHQIHYATIMPSNSTTAITTNGKGPKESPVMRKQTELERAKAVR